MLSWHSQLKQKADLVRTNANICEPRAQTCLLTDTRDRNCCDPAGVIVMGRSVNFKDQTVDGSVRNAEEPLGSIPGQPEECLSIVWPSVACTPRHTDTDADLHLRAHRNNHNHKEPVWGQPACPVTALHCCQPRALLHFWQGGRSGVSQTRRRSRDGQRDQQHLPSH